MDAPQKPPPDDFFAMIEAAQRYSCPQCGGDLREPDHVCTFDNTPDEEMPF